MNLRYSKEIKFIPNFQNDIKLDKERIEKSVKCICGHSIHIPAFLDKIVCSYCGRKVKNTTKNHFKYKLRKLLHKM